MTHLTMCGYYAGRPLCDCDKQAALGRGEQFVHAMYHRPQPGETVCPLCQAAWDDAEDSDDEQA